MALSSALLLSALGAGMPSTSGARSSATRAAAATVSCPDQNLAYSDPNRPVIRAAIVCLVNQVRAAYGLPAVAENAQLDSSAQGHSDDMVARDYFDHDSPDGSTPRSRDAAAGYQPDSYGENIAGGFSTPYAVMTAWMNDYIHCNDILDPSWRDTGVGINRSGLTFQSGPTWTEEFGLRQGDTPPSQDTDPENSCPHPLSRLPAARPAPAPTTLIAVVGQAAIRGRAIVVRVRCLASAGCRLTAQISVTSLAPPQTSAATRAIIGTRARKRLRLRLSRAALRSLRRHGPTATGVLTIMVSVPDHITVQDPIAIATARR